MMSESISGETLTTSGLVPSTAVTTVPRVKNWDKYTKRKPYNEKARRATVKASLGADDLRPWHIKMALWIVNQPKTPTLNQMLVQARRACGVPLQLPDIRVLLRNPAFQKAIHECAASETARARSTIESDLVEMAELHTEAARALKKEGKWDKVHNYTTQYLDRAWPKADQELRSPTQVNITIGGTFAQQYHQVSQAEIVEVVEVRE
jgi:hypothetical protein